jgi:poly(A) polymerase
MFLSQILKIAESVDDSVLSTAKEIVAKIRNAGFKKTHFVGGYVRDTLMGLNNAKDIDIATEATTQQILDLFPGSKPVEVGGTQNIALVTVNGNTYEIATFRKDNNEGGDGRRPGSISQASEEEDAKRRDFTINALYYDPLEDKYIDHVGGRQDIKDKLIRTVGDPNERFREDYLRMLRAIRFAAQKGLSIQDNTYEAIKNNSKFISKITKERVKIELEKILTSREPSTYVKMLEETGLLKEMIPKIVVDEDVLSAIDLSESTPAIRWAALLYKFPTEAFSILSNLLFDNSTKNDIIWLIKNYNEIDTLEDKPTFYKKEFVAHRLFMQTLNLYKAIMYATGKNKLADVKIDSLKSFYDSIFSDDDLIKQIKKFDLIDGEDLKSAGMKPGKEMGDFLKKAKEDYLNGVFSNRKEALEYMNNKIRS